MRNNERLPAQTRQTLRTRAREMRQQMSAAEVRLWSKIRGDRIGALRFRRQHVIGPFVADFYCAQLNLVIEVDGDSHFEPGQDVSDQERTRYLTSRGLHVLRFTNVDVLTNLDGVIRQIARYARIE
jgi:very-short-patch-repair endonuclease